MLAVVQWRTTNVYKCADYRCDYLLESSPETLRNAGWMRVTRTYTNYALSFSPKSWYPLFTRYPKMMKRIFIFSTLFKPSLGMPQNGGSANIAGKGRDSLRLRRCGSAWRPWWCMLFSMLAFAGRETYQHNVYHVVCMLKEEQLPSMIRRSTFN